MHNTGADETWHKEKFTALGSRLGKCKALTWHIQWQKNTSNICCIVIVNNTGLSAQKYYCLNEFSGDQYHGSYPVDGHYNKHESKAENGLSLHEIGPLTLSR